MDLAKVVTLGLFVTVVMLIWYDFRYYRLPNYLTLPLLAAGLLWISYVSPDRIFLHAMASITCFLFMLSIGWLYEKLRGTVGLGMGDVKLVAAISAWVGLYAMPIILLLSSILSLFYVSYISWSAGKNLWSVKIPFGAMLALTFFCYYILQQNFI